MPAPLELLNVLDFTSLLPGPFATMMLADLGANVVRVEAPDRPDLMRLAPPYDGETSVGHALVNRSKRSVALDLKHPDASGIVKRLVERYDVVVEGFRPGVMERLGLGYEALAAVNPQIVYCSITGYGHTGPYRDRAGHDINFLALSGLMSYTGRSGQGPVIPGLQLADVAGGSLHAAVAILAAVVYRTETEKGQHIDLSILDGTFAMSAFPTSLHLAGGERLDYENTPLNGGSYYDFYRTRDDRYLAVGSLEPKFWTGFCEALGRPDLVDRGFNVWDTAVQRRLKEEIQEIIGTRTLAEWERVFRDRDVCIEPVLRLDEAVAHPQIQARRMIVEVAGRDGASQRQVGSPFRFSEGEVTYRHTGARLGAHTWEVLREVGYSEEQFDAFAAAGLFGDLEDAG